MTVDPRPRRQVIQTGDVVIHAVEQEMEAVQCRTCFRPFWVAASLVAKIRQDGNSTLWCPVGHQTRPDKPTEVKR